MISQLRIVIDGRSLQGERTGVGTYTSNLLEQLLLLNPFIRILLTTNQDLAAAGWTGAEQIQVLKIPSLSRNNFIWTNLSLIRQLSRYSFDVFHSPGYTLPLWLRAPSAVTIHDISYAAHPEWYPHSNGVARKAWYRLSARRADGILTPSEFSGREIARVYDIPAEKILVVSLGVDRQRFRKIEARESLDDLKRRYGISGDFLLFVGDIHRRRNVKRILAAYEAIKHQEFQTLELVLIGRLLDSSISAREIAGSSCGQSVRMLGYVPERDLVLFYSLAKALVFPSFYEGFGLGVLEAMACGCPVIVSRGTACEEIAGEAAILVDPADTKSIVDAALGILKNQHLAAQHSEAGLIRSGQFTWRKTAEQTMLVYHRLAGRQSISGNDMRLDGQ